MIGFRILCTAALAVTCAVAGCERREGTRAAGGDGARSEALAATPGRSQHTAPYVARSLASVGRLTGFVEIDGTPPADTVFQPAVDQLVCGTGFTRRGIETRGNRVVGVVVWIDGIRSGKPMPLDRRFEVANDRCVLVPELQTAVAGGTLNVRNQDALEHRTRVVRRDGGELVATIRETDEGQVVPDERVLAKPGVLELSCAVHSWTHGWIAVFDHPYFTTTGTDGSFVLDSIPPGTHRVRLWHPRLGSVEESVSIEAGGTATVTLHAKAAVAR